MEGKLVLRGRGFSRLEVFEDDDNILATVFEDEASVKKRKV
jgi:hypothetical protein